MSTMPDLISQELIYSNLYHALELTDSILQIWITLTFAVIVSTYVAGQRFDRLVYKLISGLYSLASIVLFTRFGAAAYQAFFYKNLLVARQFSAWALPHWVSVVIGVGTAILIVGGTVGTLWFVRNTWKNVDASH